MALAGGDSDAGEWDFWGPFLLSWHHTRSFRRRSRAESEQSRGSFVRRTIRFVFKTRDRGSPEFRVKSGTSIGTQTAIGRLQARAPLLGVLVITARRGLYAHSCCLCEDGAMQDFG
jgi:hypothetical protein